MKKYRAVVFDWDGTVMDSTHGIVAAMQGACADMGLPIPDASKARWVIGLSLEAGLYHVVPDLTEQQMPDFLKSYRTHFLRRDAQMVLFDGVRGLLSDLADSGVQMAIATGKTRAGLDRVLAAAQLQKFFACTRCADETAGKPDPAMLLEIQHAFDVDADEMVMIGDTSHDIQMATSAGADSVAVTYGAHDKQTLVPSRPTAMVNSVAQLGAWLLQRV